VQSRKLFAAFALCAAILFAQPQPTPETAAGLPNGVEWPRKGPVTFLHYKPHTVIQRTEAPLVVAVGSGGVVTVRVKHVRQIRVTDGDTQQVIKDVDFERLSEHEIGEGNRILWNEYARVDGISVRIDTYSSQVGQERPLSFCRSRFLNGMTVTCLIVLRSVDADIDPEGPIKRVGEFAVMRFRFSL